MTYLREIGNTSSQTQSNLMKIIRSSLFCLALFSLVSFSSAQASPLRELSPGAFRSLQADEYSLSSTTYVAAPLPDLVVPADTFQISVAGFNASGAGAFIIAPITATFGLTQTFAGGLGGQTITVTSSETVGVNTVDSVTISVPTNFVPAGTTIGGLPVTTLQLDMGRLNAGTNGFDLVLPIASATGSGSILFSGGTLALTPTVALTNGGTTLSGSEGVAAGGSDLSSFAIRSFTLSFTYATVPEPSTWMLLGFGVVLVGFAVRRRHVASR